MHFIKNKIPYKNMKIWFETQLENFPPEPDQLTMKKVTIEKIQLNYVKQENLYQNITLTVLRINCVVCTEGGVGTTDIDEKQVGQN